MSGTGTTASGALTDMFTSTGGTFTGTPEINTIYYLSTDNMIVRKTEIATLNGYVGSMIDASGGGLPEGATAYQQLVTDGEGNTKWEDRLCYSYQGEEYTSVLDTSQFTHAYTIGQNSGFSYNGQSYIIAAIDDKYAEQIPLLVMFLPGAEPFPVGAKCKVTFDDTIYNCEIVEDAEYCWHIGNMSIGQPSDYPDTGEPFCFEFGIPGYNLYIPGEYKGNGIYVYTLHGLKIEMASEIVVPIDPKWLPVVDSVTLNSSTNGSSKKFKITVDDSGTISATEVT